MHYLVPRNVDEAVAMLADGPRTIVAGGTDFYPARVGRPITEPVIDVSGLEDLRGVVATDGGYRIGGLTRWSDIVRAELPAGFRGLQLAAAEVGGIQVQNAGTIAGNICNASPAADSIPPLLTLDARVELRSARGLRDLPLEEFLTGYRRTALEPDEMVTAVTVPEDRALAESTFLKLGSREYLVISIVMVAASVSLGGIGEVASARVAVGACSPVAVRCRDLEMELAGKGSGDDLAATATMDHLGMLEPIDDVRGSAEYRRRAALTLVKRALEELGGAR